MITIPLYSPLKGYHPKDTSHHHRRHKILEDIPQHHHHGSGVYNAARYARVKTPPGITRLVADAMEEKEKEEKKAAVASHQNEDPFAFIDSAAAKAEFERPNLSYVAPYLAEDEPSFGKLISSKISPVMRRRNILENFNNYDSDMDSVNSCSSSTSLPSVFGSMSVGSDAGFVTDKSQYSHHGRYVATKLGLTLNSDHRQPEKMYLTKIKHGKMESCLPSYALSPLRSHEKPISEQEFTNSPPSFLKMSSLDCFGVGYAENHVDQYLSRANMSTPMDVRMMIEIENERKAAEAAAAVEAAQSRGSRRRRRNNRSNDSSAKISSQSNRIMFDDDDDLMASPDTRKQKSRQFGGGSSSKKFMEGPAPTAKCSPPKDVFMSRQTSEVTMSELGSASGDSQADIGSKFFLSEKARDVKSQKLLDKKAELESRKAAAMARNQEFLRMTSEALGSNSPTRRSKPRHSTFQGEVIVGFYELTAEHQRLLRQYVGEKAKTEFLRLFTEAVHDLSKFPTDDDVPRHKRTPMYYFVREQAKRQLPPLPLLIRDEDDPLSISLGGKGLGDLNMLPVVAVIDQLPIVESIDFSDNRMTDVSLMPLAEKLVFMTSLTHLDLSFNKIDESAETIIEYLQGKKCKLKTLVLNGAGMYD
jgi:hypothetical protein